jgi:hypothetical protein
VAANWLGGLIQRRCIVRPHLSFLAIGLASLAGALATPGESKAQILYARPYSGSYFRNTNYGPGIYRQPNVQTNVRYIQMRSAYPPTDPVFALNPYSTEARRMNFQAVPTGTGGFFYSQPSAPAPVNYSTGNYYSAPAATTTVNTTGYYTTASDMSSGGAYYGPGY